MHKKQYDTTYINIVTWYVWKILKSSNIYIDQQTGISSSYLDDLEDSHLAAMF